MRLRRLLDRIQSIFECLKSTMGSCQPKDLRGYDLHSQTQIQADICIIAFLQLAGQVYFYEVETENWNVRRRACCIFFLCVDNSSYIRTKYFTSIATSRNPMRDTHVSSRRSFVDCLRQAFGSVEDKHRFRLKVTLLSRDAWTSGSGYYNVYLVWCWLVYTHKPVLHASLYWSRRQGVRLS